MRHHNESFYTELKTELEAIAGYWSTNSVDQNNGGFYGRRDFYNSLIPQANKGIILNARMLWSFSAISNYDAALNMAHLADRAFDYIHGNFEDKKNGGVYWELDCHGNSIIGKKQIYAQAFTIYALTEYFRFSGNKKALTWAKSLFELIEKHAFDKDNNGYIEAFAEDWSVLEDMRLSDKDQNVAKSMNTHLHILEAYTSLYLVCPEKKNANALENLINLFMDKFLNKESNFELFFDENWRLMSSTVSFGHDIEALWLLMEAAKALKIPKLIKKVETVSITIADAFLTYGYIKNAGVLNELDRKTGKVDTDRHWWPQIEAMVGLNYAYAIQPKIEYFHAIKNIWGFIKDHIIDKENGEWHFRVDENFVPNTNEDKLSMWKCPYHNARGLIMMLAR